LSDWSASA